MVQTPSTEAQLKSIVQAKHSKQEKMTRLLQLGCDHFGLMLGVISEIKGTDYHVVSAYPDGIIEGGSDFNLHETICEQTFQKEKVTSFHKASGTKWAEHPAYEKFAIESYIGINYLIDEKIIGTINFSSPTALGQDFEKEDKKMIKQFAKALSKIQKDEK